MEELPSRRAVVFDMDGVLVDTEPLHARIAHRTASEAGFEMGESDFDRYVGIPDREMWADICSRFGRTGGEIGLARRQRELTLAEFAANPPLPIPGIPELVEELTAAGFSIGLASSSERELIDLILEGIGLRQSFGAVVGRDEVTGGKPEPDLYLEACRRLGASPVRTTAIEDSLPGLEAAVRAGCRRVAYAPGGLRRSDGTEPDLVVGSFGTAAREMIIGLAGR